MTAVIFSDKKRGVIAGLEWRTLQFNGPSNQSSKEIRDLANDHDANLIVVHAVNSGAGVQAALGMYVFDDPDEKRPGELHSLGALLVRAFPTQLNMVLAWRLEHTTAVIVVKGGIPIVDIIKNHDEATALIAKASQGEFGFSGHALFSNDTRNNPKAEYVSEAVLWNVCAKDTRLTRVPASKTVIVIGVVVALLLIIGAISAWKIPKMLKYAAMEAMQRQLDPLPAYQDSLAININQMGFDRESIQTTFSQIGSHPIWESGWLLTKIECDRNSCISTWTRKSGTTEDLLKARVGEEILPESTDEVVYLQWKSALKISGIGDLAKATVENVAKMQNTNTFQIWRNAKIDVIESPENFKVWPVPTVGNVSQLQNSSTLRRRSVEVTVLRPLVEQLIDQAPSALWWQSFTIAFSPGDSAQLLKVTLKGSIYVH